MQTVNIYSYRNYRDFLKDLLAERVVRNPSYSLRAMASNFGILPSHLSQILNGKKNLSMEKSYSVAERMGLKGEETEFFSLLVQLEQASSPKIKADLVTRLESFSKASTITDLSIDLFKLISDWYHIPILEMVALRKSPYTPDTIAKRLGITKLEAERAIERLIRLELLKKTEKGGYKKVQSNLLFKSPLPNQALRHFHKQMLERAIESLEKQTSKEKYIGSETFAVDPALLEGASKIIERFRRELVDYFDQGKIKTQIYHLGLQLFRVTKQEEK